MVRHVAWFLGEVENFRFFDVKVYAFADPEAAVAEFKAEGLIKSTRRIYALCVLRAARLRSSREYFNPASAAKALDIPILGLES